MKLLKLVTLPIIAALVLTGCSPSESTGAYENLPGDSATEKLNLNEGDGSMVVEFPDFNSAGEEGEPTAAAWDAFAEIADNSKFKFLEEGGYEYFGMYDEPYIMFYDPNFPEGKYWVVYFDENSGNVSVGYDVFEMAPYNAGLELYLYGDVSERPISGAGVSRNPDGTYSVNVAEEDYYLRYIVKDGLISGRSVWDGDSGTFLGYTSVEYGLSQESKSLVEEAYRIAVEAGEEFEIPEESKIMEEAPQE